MRLVPNENCVSLLADITERANDVIPMEHFRKAVQLSLFKLSHFPLCPNYPGEALVSFVPRLEELNRKMLIQRGVADSGVRNRNAQMI
jgi:hypothetical protein